MKERIIYDPGAPVPIRRYSSEGLAAIDKALLEAADIPAFIRQNRYGEVDIGVVLLVVRQEHARTALALLADLPGAAGGHTRGGQHEMVNLKLQPRVTSFAPQFLVDDLERSMTYYRKLGFTFGEPWDGFYAIGKLDGLELHLKEAPKNSAERQWRREHEHLDAAAGVDGIEAFHERCVANGATILRPLTPTEWGTKDFYIEDPDGYIIAFGGSPTEHETSQEPSRA